MGNAFIKSFWRPFWPPSNFKSPIITSADPPSLIIIFLQACYPFSRNFSPWGKTHTHNIQTRYFLSRLRSFLFSYRYTTHPTHISQKTQHVACLLSSLYSTTHSFTSRSLPPITSSLSPSRQLCSGRGNKKVEAGWRNLVCVCVCVCIELAGYANEAKMVMMMMFLLVYDGRAWRRMTQHWKLKVILYLINSTSFIFAFFLCPVLWDEIKIMIPLKKAATKQVPPYRCCLVV